MSEWKRIIKTEIIQTHRTGWLGVWDAIKSAITKDDRLQVPRTITISFFAKSEIDGVWGFQSEIEDKK